MFTAQIYILFNPLTRYTHSDADRMPMAFAECSLYRQLNSILRDLKSVVSFSFDSTSLQTLLESKRQS